jgi:hypothetical protein
VSSPPMATTAPTWWRTSASITIFGPLGALEGVGPGGAEDRPPDLEDRRRGVLPGDAEVVVLEEPLPPVPHPGELEPVLLPAADHRPDDRVEPGAVSSPGEDGDLHVDDLRSGSPETSIVPARARQGAAPGGGVRMRARAPGRAASRCTSSGRRTPPPGRTRTGAPAASAPAPRHCA